MREISKLKTIEEIPLVDLGSQIRDEGELIAVTWYTVYDKQQVVYHNTVYHIQQVVYHVLKQSLASSDSESIIPEWFFKTVNMIEPERVEFKNDSKI